MKFKFNGKTYRINERKLDRICIGLVCVGVMAFVFDIVFNFTTLSTTAL